MSDRWNLRCASSNFNPVRATSGRPYEAHSATFHCALLLLIDGRWFVVADRQRLDASAVRVLVGPGPNARSKRPKRIELLNVGTDRAAIERPSSDGAIAEAQMLKDAVNCAISASLGHIPVRAAFSVDTLQEQEAQQYLKACPTTCAFAFPAIRPRPPLLWVASMEHHLLHHPARLPTLHP